VETGVEHLARSRHMLQGTKWRALVCVTLYALPLWATVADGQYWRFAVLLALGIALMAGLLLHQQRRRIASSWQSGARLESASIGWLALTVVLLAVYAFLLVTHRAPS
jgi:hypothetical protein